MDCPYYDYLGGFITVLTGFAQSATHLYILRFLLGVAEAGFLPGILLYLTYWFRKKRKSDCNIDLITGHTDCINYRFTAIHVDYGRGSLGRTIRLALDVYS